MFFDDFLLPINFCQGWIILNKELSLLFFCLLNKIITLQGLLLEEKFKMKKK